MYDADEEAVQYEVDYCATLVRIIQTKKCPSRRNPSGAFLCPLDSQGTGYSTEPTDQSLGLR